MARNFRRPRTAQPIADLNVTNMIDLGFTLLIIFMISTPLLIQEQSIKLNLPTEPVRPQEKSDNTPVQVISVDKTGKYFWGTAPVTLAELRTKLAEVSNSTKSTRMTSKSVVFMIPAPGAHQTTVHLSAPRVYHC